MMQSIISMSLLSALRITADNTAAAVDIREFTGLGKAILDASATEAADNTLDVKLQHCATVDGAYTDAGVVFEQVTSAGASHQQILFSVDELERFVKVVSAVAGTSPAATLSVSLIGKKQSI